MIFWALSISSGFSTHIIIMLNNTFPVCLGNYAGEMKVNSAFFMSML